MFPPALSSRVPGDAVCHHPDFFLVSAVASVSFVDDVLEFGDLLGQGNPLIGEVDLVIHDQQDDVIRDPIESFGTPPTSEERVRTAVGVPIYADALPTL